MDHHPALLPGIQDEVGDGFGCGRMGQEASMLALEGNAISLPGEEMGGTRVAGGGGYRARWPKRLKGWTTNCALLGSAALPPSHGWRSTSAVRPMRPSRSRWARG